MAKLVLIRHGQSQWNLENRFTGWMDVPLSKKGEEEARRAGQALKGIPFQRAFTSKLKRAQETLRIILEEIGQTGIPIVDDQALNERHYGDLQGLNKAETAEKFGAEQVHIWRRSYDVAPPNGESLKDTAARTLPYFQSQILPLVKAGHNVLIAAHGNSLRSIVMDLDQLTRDQVLKLEIPTGAPIIYDIDAAGRMLERSKNIN
ncbi:MAG: 2,3-bisphosphoglycerate-dependent phosphoglycerate mutase [Elusimicrobia bacterium RIFCSPLOWO2_01_FULL_59_12]|nr:MAG: 2,3-bisphosphoglycerate-dependent phosphoglycerate mutase [Elusimicrobia bacterium RIFCSPLOWO2_01_FULL_59_12]